MELAAHDLEGEEIGGPPGGVGQEVGDQGGAARGVKVSHRGVELAHEKDCAGVHAPARSGLRVRHRAASRAQRPAMGSRVGARRCVLRGLRAQLRRLGRRRHRRPRGADREARLSRDKRPGRRRALADAGLQVAELPRLRHDRLRDDQPRLRHQCRFRPPAGGGAPPRHPGDRGLRDEPHQLPAPLVHRFGFLADAPVHRDWYVWRADDPGLDAALGRRQSHLARDATAPSTTASSGAACPTSTSRRRRCARRWSASPRSGCGAGSTASGSTPRGICSPTGRAICRTISRRPTPF